jgi:hypothetical protein
MKLSRGILPILLIVGAFSLPMPSHAAPIVSSDKKPQNYGFSSGNVANELNQAANTASAEKNMPTIVGQLVEAEENWVHSINQSNHPSLGPSQNTGQAPIDYVINVKSDPNQVLVSQDPLGYDGSDVKETVAENEVRQIAGKDVPLSSATLDGGELGDTALSSNGQTPIQIDYGKTTISSNGLMVDWISGIADIIARQIRDEANMLLAETSETVSDIVQWISNELKSLGISSPAKIYFDEDMVDFPVEDVAAHESGHAEKFKNDEALGFSPEQLNSLLGDPNNQWYRWSHECYAYLHGELTIKNTIHNDAYFKDNREKLQTALAQLKASPDYQATLKQYGPLVQEAEDLLSEANGINLQ